MYKGHVEDASVWVIQYLHLMTSMHSYFIVLKFWIIRDKFKDLKSTENATCMLSKTDRLAANVRRKGTQIGCVLCASNLL